MTYDPAYYQAHKDKLLAQSKAWWATKGKGYNKRSHFGVCSLCGYQKELWSVPVRMKNSHASRNKWICISCERRVKLHSHSLTFSGKHCVSRISYKQRW